MAEHSVKFDVSPEVVRLPTGALLTEATRLAGVEINQPCGGQGRCGRCVVQIESGQARRRSTLRLSREDIDAGYALACQTVVEGDLEIIVPPQEKIERKLTTDRIVREIEVPHGYRYQEVQPVKRINVTLAHPSMDDQTDDLSRLLTALRQKLPDLNIEISLPVLRKLGAVLREAEWSACVLLHHSEYSDTGQSAKVLDIRPGHEEETEPLWAAAIDIGTTTVTVWLVDLVSGKVHSQAAEYNGQITRGEDVISRIIYAGKDTGAEELQSLVLDTINKLLVLVCKRAGGLELSPTQILKATVTGNSTMLHLFLKLPPSSIRLSPFITTANAIPLIAAGELGLGINTGGLVDCLPGVASYVGADITAGVYVSGMEQTDTVTLFMDVGTNGEIVLGSREWLVTCACSAGPAFEGAGVFSGMRATKGAIEEVWINGNTFQPSYRVIGGDKPIGICGSGLISLLAEMFMTGVVDKGGNLNSNLDSDRVRDGKHGLEYVIVFAADSGNEKDIVITEVDIDNLIRAKGAIYAGYTVLADSVGVPLDTIEQMYIGGSFGKYINVEKAVQIGLLPDMPWERFQFLGNTSVQGAYLALLDENIRQQINEIAARMTYIELSSDNKFYDAFMSAVFLPHTDMSRFPTVESELRN